MILMIKVIFITWIYGMLMICGTAISIILVVNKYLMDTEFSRFSIIIIVFGVIAGIIGYYKLFRMKLYKKYNSVINKLPIVKG
jgi:hypothetical protein